MAAKSNFDPLTDQPRTYGEYIKWCAVYFAHLKAHHVTRDGRVVNPLPQWLPSEDDPTFQYLASYCEAKLGQPAFDISSLRKIAALHVTHTGKTAWELNATPLADLVNWLRARETSLTATAETPPEQNPSSDAEAVIKSLQPAARKAYRAFEYAQEKAEKELLDREAFEWIAENGIEEDDPKFGDLCDYKPPRFTMWTGQLRTTRTVEAPQRINPSSPAGSVSNTRRRVAADVFECADNRFAQRGGDTVERFQGWIAVASGL